MRFPRAVVFGTSTYGGMGWESMNSIQIYEKIKSFIRNIRTSTRLGNLLQVATSTAQIHAGISDSILKTDIRWHNWSPESWFTHFSINLQSIGGSMETHLLVNGPTRKYDRNLMNIFLRLNLTDIEMDYLNKCRLYLQVIMVADITTLDGRTILEDYAQCKKVRSSVLQWPYQVEPPKKMKAMWISAMNRLCSISTILVCTLGS